MADTNAVPDSLEALPDVQAAPEDKTLPKLDSAPKSGFMSSLWDVLKTDAAVKRHAMAGAAADIVGAVGAKGLASHIRSAAPLPKPETEAGVRVQRYETRYIDDVREQEKQISSAIANGTSAAQEPGRSAWELIQVPIQGALHGASSAVGWAVGLGYTAYGNPAKGAGLEKSIGNFVPAPQPTTALGREWNAWGMLFAPLTESVHAGEQEYNADTDHPSPWMHYAFEAGSFGTMILGGKGLGELGGAVGRATGVLDKDIPVAHSTKRDVPGEVRVPKRPGVKAEEPAEPVAEPKDTLFDTGDAEIEREATRQAERDKFHDLNRAREQNFDAEDGIVVHHGSNQNIDRPRASPDDPFFLTKEKSEADRYASNAAHLNGGRPVTNTFNLKGANVFRGSDTHAVENVVARAFKDIPTYVMGDGQTALLINGKKTLLTKGVLSDALSHHDWSIIESPEIAHAIRNEGFHAFMSKVGGVDSFAVMDPSVIKNVAEDQGPLILYHGTSGDFREFDDERLGQNTGHMTAPLGHFLAEDVRKAKAYAEKASNYIPVDERVIKAQVDIHHPKEMSLQDLMDIDSQDESRALRAKLMQQGYDGIHIPEIGQWVAFTGKQIHIIDPAEEAFERTSNAQADSILDYQNTLRDAAQARLDDADFDAAAQSAARTDELLRGGGPGHAGIPRGQYTGDWHDYLASMAQLAGVDISELHLSSDELEGLDKEPGEFDDLETLSHEIPEWDENGLERMTPRARENLAALKAKRSLRASFRNKVRDFRTGLRKVYAGATSKASEAHIAHVAQTMALDATERERMDAVNTGIRKVFARMNDEDLAAWWRHFQKGVPMPDHLGDRADWASIDKFYEDVFARGLEERALAGDPIEPMTRAKYFPQYARPKDWTQRLNLGLSGKERAFDTMDNLLDAGVEPLSMNPAVHFHYWLRGQERAIGRAELRWQKIHGGLRVVPKSYVPAPDELTLESPDGLLRYAGKADLISFMNKNVLAKPFMGFDANLMTALRAVGLVKNSAQALLFGFNPFHGIHIGVFVRPLHGLAESLSLIDNKLTPSGVVDMAKAFGKMFTTADGPKVRGVRLSARSIRKLASGKQGGIRFNPKTRAVEFPEGGDPFLDVIDVVRHGADPSILKTPGQEILRRAVVGGYEIHNPEWTNEAHAKFLEGIQDATASGYMRAAGWTVPTFLRALGYPMMDQFVPLVKLRAYAADTERWHQANPTVEAGSAAERVAFARIRREIDQRFGEMNTKLLGVHPIILAGFQGSMLSFGWNFGLASQFGGGGKDAVHKLFDAATGAERDKMRSRALYASLYAGYACMAGALVTKAFSGKDPETLKDCIYPIVGTDSKGNAIRVKLPSLMNDFGAEVYNVRDKGLFTGTKETAFNKAAPIFNSLDQFFSNHNWMGQKISDPYAPATQQIAQRFRAVMEGLEPISITQAERQVHDVTPAEQKALSVAAFAGITKAPEYVTTPAPIEQIYRVSAILGGQETYASTQLYQAENRANLRDLFEDGTRSGDYGAYRIAERQFQAKWNAMHPDTPLTKTGLRALRKRLRAPRAAMTLQNEQNEGQEHVWQSMQDYGDGMAMLAQYLPYFHTTVKQQMFKRMTPQEQAELKAQWRALRAPSTAPTTPPASAPQG